MVKRINVVDVRLSLMRKDKNKLNSSQDNRDNQVFANMVEATRYKETPSMCCIVLKYIDKIPHDKGRRLHYSNSDWTN